MLIFNSCFQIHDQLICDAPPQLCHYGCGEVGAYIIGKGETPCCSATYYHCRGYQNKKNKSMASTRKAPVREVRTCGNPICCNMLWVYPTKVDRYCGASCAATMNNKDRTTESRKQQGLTLRRNKKEQHEEAARKKLEEFNAKKGLLPCDYGCETPAYYYFASNNKLCCSKEFHQCTGFSKKQSIVQTKAHKNPNRTKIKLKEPVLELIFKKDGNHDTARLKKLMCADPINRKYECEFCHIFEWNGKPLCLELDHINGVHTDNRLENLRLLCPNCHSLTTTHRGKNSRRNEYKPTAEEIMNAIITSKNVRQTLVKLRMSARGDNYSKIYQFMGENNLQFGVGEGI